jgi:prevent-host-death family protein
MVSDHGTNGRMRSITISKFKATCLAVLERVRKTGEPVVVTKRGAPIVEIVSAPPAPPKGTSFGCMAGKAKKFADIVEPIGPEIWDALK